MRSHIKSSTHLDLKLLVFSTFLIFGSYYCSAQQETVTFKDLVESTDSLNSPIYLYNGSPYTGVVRDFYKNGELAAKVNLNDGKFNGFYVVIMKMAI